MTTDRLVSLVYSMRSLQKERETSAERHGESSHRSAVLLARQRAAEAMVDAALNALAGWSSGNTHGATP